ncbi:putative protein TPRXL, partial [Aplysia californica]|uniref:Uncharacterized protein n=1 Tax=Aplysia californica TaxID=6500 RepID=A0ABM1AFJ0_APLCA
MIRGRKEGSNYATWFIGFDHDESFALPPFPELQPQSPRPPASGRQTPASAEVADVLSSPARTPSGPAASTQTPLSGPPATATSTSEAGTETDWPDTVEACTATEPASLRHPASGAGNGGSVNGSGVNGSGGVVRPHSTTDASTDTEVGRDIRVPATNRARHLTAETGVATDSSLSAPDSDNTLVANGRRVSSTSSSPSPSPTPPFAKSGLSVDASTCPAPEGEGSRLSTLSPVPFSPTPQQQQQQ